MGSSAALGYGALLHLLLLQYSRVLVQCQSDDSSDSTCTTFLADVLGSAGSLTSQETFTCGDDAYVTGLNINHGWWMDALQIVCSTGDASDWYGDGESVDGLGESSLDTGGGLISMSSHFKIWYDQAYPCLYTFFAYSGEEEGSSSGSELGPFGSCGRNSSTSSTSTWDTTSGEYNGTSECGSDAYTVGFLVHYDDVYIYGLGLQCRTITAACPAPDGLAIPYTLSPTPAPVRETPTPAEPTVELGGDCSEYACVEDLCCSEDEICGATASFCRDGLCCSTSDESDCEAGSNQCLTEEDAESYWYDSPVFIGTSSAVGLLISLGGGSYAVYRHFCKERDSCISSQ